MADKGILDYNDLKLFCNNIEIPSMKIEYGTLPDGQVFFFAVIDKPPRKIFSGRFMYDGDEPIEYIIRHLAGAMHEAAYTYSRQVMVEKSDLPSK